MGIENSGGNFLWLNVSCGRLVNKKKGVDCQAYSGYIIGFERKDDEYEGKAVSRIIVKMKDHTSDEVAKISFNEESYFSLGFFSQIVNCDPKKVTRVATSQSKNNEKISFCWIDQEGKKIERDETFPAPVKKKIGRNEVVDWSPTLEAIESFLTGPKAAEFGGVAVASAPESTPANVSPANDPHIVKGGAGPDDLPF